jgi:hypothetical protein
MMQSMAIKIVDITNYSPKSSDVFFFDNTVWMYLFCPLGSYNQKKQKHYSSFLKNVGSSKCTIYISSLILSEFANRYLRLDFELWKNETKNYSANFKRNFIGTQRYKDTIEEVTASINNIMSLCEKTPDNFNAVDFINVLEHFVHVDFNDSYYLELARISKLKIVTDDSDFVNYTNHSIEIFTIGKAAS